MRAYEKYGIYASGVRISDGCGLSVQVTTVTSLATTRAMTMIPAARIVVE